MNNFDAKYALVNILYFCYFSQCVKTLQAVVSNWTFLTSELVCSAGAAVRAEL